MSYRLTVAAAELAGALGEADGGALALRIVVGGDNEMGQVRRRREHAKVPRGERGGGVDVRQGRDDREHGLDPLADEKRSAVVGRRGAEAVGEAVDAPGGLARPRDRGLGGPRRVEPGAVDAGDVAVDVGDGGDERGIAPEPLVAAIGESWVEPQGLEAAGAKRGSTEVVADEVEEIAVLAGCAVAPLADSARRPIAASTSSTETNSWKGSSSSPVTVKTVMGVSNIEGSSVKGMVDAAGVEDLPIDPPGVALSKLSFTLCGDGRDRLDAGEWRRIRPRSTNEVTSPLPVRR